MRSASQPALWLLIVVLTACSGTSDDSAPDSDAVDSGIESLYSVLGRVPSIAPMANLCAEPTPEKMTWPMDAARVSLSVFHFNLQYVAGGLDNFLGLTVSEIAMEDAIIVESFEPLVDLFERHPNWGGSFEMQGYMLEVMAQRHPEVAKRLHHLVRRGQVDLMSFHWSDQLVTAYSKYDMDWSWAENQRVFDALCMPRAKVHFLQEGQFGPGLSAFVDEKEGGILVLPRNLLKYHHDPHPVGLVFDNDGHQVIVTNGFAADVLEVGWNFADDGELLATGNTNPYMFTVFKHDPAYLKAEYEDKLTALEEDGWTIAPISHYVRLLADRGVEPTLIDPPVLDGSWQPKDSGNMFIWMGGEGLVPGDERDNTVLTGNVIARQHLLAVETLLKMAKSSALDTEDAEKWFRIAVRELLLAECSDTSGWRPQKTEVDYGLKHQAEAFAIARSLGKWLLKAMGHSGTVAVDSNALAIVTAAPAAMPTTTLNSPPKALLGVVVESERPHPVEWRKYGEEYYELRVLLPATDDETEGPDFPPPVTLIVPLAHDAIEYSPALTGHNKTVRVFPLSEYAFAKDNKRFGLPLTNGLLGIAPNWTLVLDQRTMHLAANFEKGRVTFEDRTIPAQNAVEWRIRFYPQPASQVVAKAHNFNLRPMIWWSL